MRGEFPGKIYPVNPRYRELLGLGCYPDLASLPATPELVIFCVGESSSIAVDALPLGSGVNKDR